MNEAFPNIEIMSREQLKDFIIFLKVKLTNEGFNWGQKEHRDVERLDLDKLEVQIVELKDKLREEEELTEALTSQNNSLQFKKENEFSKNWYLAKRIVEFEDGLKIIARYVLKLERAAIRQSKKTGDYEQISTFIVENHPNMGVFDKGGKKNE